MTCILEFRADAASIEALRQFVVGHLVAGIDSVSEDGRRVSRSVDAGGQTHQALVDFRPDGVVTVDTDAPSDVETEVRTKVARWLDAGGPDHGELRTLRAEPRLAALVDARPGIRIPGAVAGLETALFAVLGQQVSLIAARTFAGRLVRFAGEDRGDGRYSTPSATRIAEAEPEEFRSALGVTGARARTLQNVAAAVAAGLELRPGVDLADTRRALLALPGIGTWTTEYIALRCLGDRDALPGGDLVLRRQLGVKTEREALAIGERWRPARGLALLHLWTDAVFA